MNTGKRLFTNSELEEIRKMRLIAAAPDLLAALNDAEFILRKLAINPKEAIAFADTLKRAAHDCQRAIAKAKSHV